jgi:membrane protease YdiL (CAAX protease family)
LNDSTKLYPSQPGNVEPESSAPAQLVPAKPSLLRAIFIGSDGLRAGWSLLLFTLILGVLLQGIAFGAYKMHFLPQKGVPVGELPPSLGPFAEGLPFLMTFLAAWIMSKIEKRQNSVYGLGGPRALPNFFAGLAWGVTYLSLLVFILWKTRLLVEDSRLLFGAGALHYAIIWLLVFLMVGFFEEYLTRGYVLFTLTRGLAGIYSWMFKTPHAKALAFWTSALLLSILFGLGHKQNPGESPIGMFSAGLIGLIFSLSLWRTGSLWWAIGFHAAWDWAQSFLYGVADSGLMVQHHFLATHPFGSPLMSGGATGPEGSVFVLPVLALATCTVVFTLPRTNASNGQNTTPVGRRVT